MSFWGYAVASALGFLAGGAGVAVVAYLGRELLGHWLAKELQVRGAALETAEHRRRVAFEALHARRMAVADEVSRTVGDTLQMMVNPPNLRGVEKDPKDSYELRHFEHWRALREQGDKAVKSAVSGVSLFEETRLVELTLEWARQLIATVDPYQEAIAQVTADRGQWSLPDDARIARLEGVRKKALGALTPGLAEATQNLNDHLREVMAAR